LQAVFGSQITSEPVERSHVHFSSLIVPSFAHFLLGFAPSLSVDVAPPPTIMKEYASRFNIIFNEKISN
jgi:hypothetical protein